MTAHKLGPESRGVFVISATPFHEDGALDLASLDRALEFYLSARGARHHAVGDDGRGAQTHQRRERDRGQAGTRAHRRARPRRDRRERRIAGVDARPRAAGDGRWGGGRHGGAPVRTPHRRRHRRLHGHRRRYAGSRRAHRLSGLSPHHRRLRLGRMPARVIADVATVAMYKAEDVPRARQDSQTRASNATGRAA